MIIVKSTRVISISILLPWNMEAIMHSVSVTNGQNQGHQHDQGPGS